MKRFALLSVFITAVLTASFAQSPNDSITMKKVFGGYQFYHGEKRLNMNQMEALIKTNQEAYQQFKSAKTTNSIASAFGIAGGFLVGWPVGTAIGGGEPNWILAGIGAGLIVISIPISSQFNKQVKHAVNTYNKGMRNTSAFRKKSEWNLSINNNGIGLIFRF